MAGEQVEGELAALDFADVLREHRVAARLTQEQLAELAGLNVRSVSQLERGRVRYPRPETVRLVGAALGLRGASMERFQRLARAGYWVDRGADPGTEPSPEPIRLGGNGDPAAASGTADGQPTGADRWVVPAQLPGDVVGFTGRAAELATLDMLLVAPHPQQRDRASSNGSTAVVISAVSGTAGVGKTALAVHWGHRAARHFPDGQLYVNLRGYDPEEPVDPADALARFLRALGVAGGQVPADLDERAARYRTELAGRRILIVLDNAATVEQVRPLLPGSPAAVVLVTSRDSLPGLVALHGAGRIDLDLLSLDDAGNWSGRAARHVPNRWWNRL